jgi:hypothetical protein
MAGGGLPEPFPLGGCGSGGRGGLEGLGKTVTSVEP